MMMMTSGAEPVETTSSAAPDSSWLNSEIEQYAADNEIDLAGATRKGDMLAVIEEQANG